MKKIILLCLIIGSGLCIQVALAQQEQKKSIDDVNIIETPFYQEMKFDLMKELKDSFYKNKDEMMSFYAFHKIIQKKNILNYIIIMRSIHLTLKKMVNLN